MVRKQFFSSQNYLFYKVKNKIIYKIISLL